MTKIIFSHPTGNANVRAALNGLSSENLLLEFNTSIAIFPSSLVSRFGGIKGFSNINRRLFDLSLKSLTQSWPIKEVGRNLALKTGINFLTNYENSLFGIDAVYKYLDIKVASRLITAKKMGVKAVFAYEDGALTSFTKAKELGLICLYDLPIGYWRAAKKYLANEVDRWPAWVNTMPSFSDSTFKLENKDRELILADTVFVASQFTANTLQLFPGRPKKIDIIPYGFPKVFSDRTYYNKYNGALKVLYVGSLSQRKGLADLFAAVNFFQKKVEFTLVGNKVVNNCQALNIELSKHRWFPTLSNQDVLKLMRVNDVLIFPSLFEGFGLVIAEAMSQGTPVITTDRTAGPDLIINNENGWLIQAGSTEAIIQAIQYLLHFPKSLSEVGKAAMESARLRPWDVYGKELATAVEANCSEIINSSQ